MKRRYEGRAALIATAVVAAIILFNLLYLSTGLERLGILLHWRWLVMPAEVFRAIHIGLMATIAFILYTATRKSARDRLPWYDLLLIVASLGSNLYFAIFYNQVVTDHFNHGIVTPVELILGLVVIGP